MLRISYHARSRSNRTVFTFERLERAREFQKSRFAQGIPLRIVEVIETERELDS